MFALACGASTGADTRTGDPAQPADTLAHAAEATPASASSVELKSFESASLGVKKDYVLYLPPGYASSPDKRWPVVYMLHGLGGSEISWRDIGIAKTADDVELGAIIVMPDGDDSFYVNAVKKGDYDACMKGRRLFGKAPNMATYCVQHTKYENYIVKDLVAHVDSTYRTVADRSARAIGGLSMGGYGSLYLSFANTDVFGAVASHAALASLIYAGPKEYERGKTEVVQDAAKALNEAGQFGILIRAVWGESLDNWRAHDPTTLAKNLKNGELAIYIDCGTNDFFKLQNHNQYLHEVLENAGVDHDWHLIEGGGHNREFWTTRIDDSLTFLKNYFERSSR